MLERSDIERYLQEYISKRPEVEFAYLFGSIARGTRFDDVDVAAYLRDTAVLTDREAHPYGYESTILGELTRLLHTDKVDFVVLNTAGPTLFTRVIKGKRILDRDPSKRILAENSIRQQFIDTEPLRNIQRFYLGGSYEVSMPDIEVVRKHLQAIVRAVAQLKRHGPYSPEALRENADLLWVLERGLYLCIQNLLDSFTHIISADLDAEGDTYAEAAAILRSHKLISAEQEELLNRMIGLRNRLSHSYLGLEPQVLADVANNRLSDLTRLANVIAGYCKIHLPDAGIASQSDSL